MGNKIKKWWKSTTMNEKLMYGLMVAFVIGIILRWNFITDEVSEAVTNMFTPYVDSTSMSDTVSVIDTLTVK